MKLIRYLLTIILLLVSSTAVALTSQVDPPEELVTLNGFQSLIKFYKGDSHKPLIIFVPGNAHLARIGYGYAEGDPKDFLAYWLVKKGFSFLAVSYPTDNSVYNKIYPEFNIEDWGNLIISAAKKVIKEEGLSNNIVIVGWSMAGSIVQTANLSAQRNGLNLELFVGLSSVPPIPYIMQDSSFTMNKMLSNHLADRTLLYPWFYKWMEEQNQYNGHVIIPQKIYFSHFLGNIPIALGAEGYHYKNNKFIFDMDKTFKESGIFNFSKIPWIAQIRDDSPITLKISSIDLYGWYFILTQMLYHNYLKNIDMSELNADDSIQLSRFIERIPSQLTKTVHGNHMFFVGEKGARETANKIILLIDTTSTIKKQLIEKNNTSNRTRKALVAQRF